MVETLDPHSPEWWRPEAEKIREQRERERPAREEAERQAIALYDNPSQADIDAIGEIVSEAVGWFDTNRPCAMDPDDFCADTTT